MTSKANWPYVINMGNSIIGVTVLAMPFCFKQCGVLLGMSLLIGSSCLTYLSCSLLVKAAHTSRKRSYEFLAFHSFGSAGKLAVEFSIIGLLIGTCIAFYVIIGDLGPAIISKMTGLENTSGLRTSLMVILALCVVLPLGLLRDLHSLSNVSAISLSFYIIFVAEVCSAALPNLWSGVWVTKVVYWNPEGVFRCLPIFSLAFACQTQLFLMYDSLPEPSLKRMSIITKRAIGLSASVYLLVGYFGYVAFCDEDISGDILMNFRPTIFSESVKLGFVLSVAISFPLVIFPCRAALYTLIYAQEGGSHDHLGGPMPIPETKFKIMTVAIVIATLIVGIKVPNIEFVLAITGATMGSMISFIFPAIMFISVMSISHSKFVAQMVLFIGVTVLLASTYVTLNGVDNAALAQESVVKIAKSADELAKPPLELPTPLTPANKESVDVNKLENKRAGDDVIKDVPVAKASMKPETKDEEKEKKKDEKRQEPPNPHAPDTGEQKNVGTGEVGGEKKGNADGVKKQDVGVKGTEKEATKGAQKKVAEKVEVKSGKTENRKDVDKKKDTNAEAKILLKELKVQHAVQEKLIEQQKEIIQELKQHQKEAHQEKPAGAAEQQPAQEQVQQQQQQVPVQQQQQQVPVQQVPVQQQQQQIPLQQQVPVQQQQVPVQQQPVQQQQQQVPLQQQQQQVPVQQQQQQVPVQQQQQVPVQQQQQVPVQQQQQVPVQQQQQQVPVQQQQQVPVQQQQQQLPVQQQQQVPVQQQQQQVPIQQQVPVQQQQQVPVQQQQQVPVQQQQQIPVQQQQQVPVQQQQQQVPAQQQVQQQQVPVQQKVPVQQQQQQVPVQQQQQQVPVQQQQQQQVPVQQQQVPQQFDPQNIVNFQP